MRSTRIAAAVVLVAIPYAAWPGPPKAPPPNPYARFLGVKQWTGALHCSLSANSSLADSNAQVSWDARSTFVLEPSPDSDEDTYVWQGAIKSQSGRINAKSVMLAEGKVLVDAQLSGSQIVPLDPLDAIGSLTIYTQAGEYTLQVHEPIVRTTMHWKAIGPGGLEAQPPVEDEDPLETQYIEHQKLPAGLALTGHATFETTMSPPYAYPFPGVIHCDWKVAPAGAQNVNLAVTGCADVASGSKSQLTARGEPAGGSYRWWTEPEQVIALAPQGASAALSGGKPGFTTVHVEYTAPGGKKEQATQPATHVRVVSINQGGAVAKLGLYDADGKPRSQTRSIPLQVEPAGDTHLAFPAADPGVVTVANHGSSLELQALRAGKTTIQGQVACSGHKTGPVAAIEVVPCDDAVIAELKKRSADAQRDIKDVGKEMNEAVTDPAFEHAAEQATKDWADMTVSAMKLVTAPASGAAAGAMTAMTAAYSMLKGEIFGGEGDVAGAEVDIAKEGLGKSHEASVNKLGGSAFDGSLAKYDRFVKAGKAVDALGKVVSFASDANAFDESLKQLTEHAGTLEDTARRVQDLEKQLQKHGQKFISADDMLTFCKRAAASQQGGQQAGGSQPPASVPPPASPPSPGSRKDVAEPAATPSAGDPPGGGDPAGDSETAGSGAEHPPRDSGSDQDGGVGADLDDLLQLEARCQKPMEQFAGKTLVDFQGEAEKARRALDDANRTANLPEAERRQRLAAGLPTLETFLAKADSFEKARSGLVESTRGCNQDVPAATGAVIQAGIKAGTDSKAAGALLESR
jgi:hypothetical protein